LRQEHDNLRAALSWAIGGGDLEIGLRLAGALAQFWYYDGPISEGEKWVRRARLSLEQLDRERISPAIRAKVYNGAGIMAFAVGDHANGKRWNHEALVISRREGDVHGQAWALLWLSAHTTIEPETYREGISLVEEALQLFKAVGDQAGLVWAFNQLGELERLVGNPDEARKAYESSLALSRETGNKRREAIALLNISYVAQGQGDYSLAKSYCVAGLGLLKELNLAYHSAIALSMLAGPLSSLGKAEQAATVLGAAEGIFERMAVTLQPADQVEIDNYAAQTREILGEIAFDLAWQMGKEMSLEQSLAYAFSAGEEI
jgi:tetratricopeptide (TPR) repeat protein